MSGPWPGTITFGFSALIESSTAIHSVGYDPKPNGIGATTRSPVATMPSAARYVTASPRVLPRPNQRTSIVRPQIGRASCREGGGGRGRARHGPQRADED